MTFSRALALLLLVAGPAAALNLQSAQPPVQEPEDEECPTMTAKEMMADLHVPTEVVETVQRMQDALPGYVKEQEELQAFAAMPRESASANGPEYASPIVEHSRTAYFIRHAEASCLLDAGLNHNGRKVATKAADPERYPEWKDVKLVYCSPAAAALETAMIMFPNVPIKISKYLIEAEGVVSRRSGIDIITTYDRSDTLESYANFWHFSSDGTSEHEQVGAPNLQATRAASGTGTFSQAELETDSISTELQTDHLQMHQRWLLFKEFIAQTQESHVAVVTHGHVLDFAFPEKHGIHKGKGVAYSLEGNGLMRMKRYQPYTWGINDQDDDYLKRR